ncbi:hypothetical protein BGZ47_006086 [Haplosporangium gracile]|nr:hypothetical protein BGZ47_006086 [Haplosporangium gracile]
MTDPRNRFFLAFKLMDKLTAHRRYGTAGTLIEASEPYAEDSLHRISNVPQVIPTTTPTTPIVLPTLTMQSEPLRLKDLELPLPAYTLPAYTLTTLDASNTVGTVPDPVPTISGEDDESLLIDEAEREALLSQIESIGHECEPQGDEGCLMCLFKSYQRLCAAALHQNELRITEVADVVALLGVLVPFKATERMKSIFQEKTLDDLKKSDEEWPDIEFNETLITSAVRHCMRGQKGRVSQLLRPLEENHRRIKLLLETCLEYLPLEEVKDLSEMDFIVKHVGPVMEAFVDSKRASSRSPNKDCETQKRLNIKPDRPDLSVVVGKTEVAFGEITGPAKERSAWKNNWDFYRTVDIEKIATGPLDQLKRSWGYKDLDKNKRLLVQGFKGRKAVRRPEPEGADGTLELGHAPPRNCNELSDAEHE